jgi:endonuclease/exonuclease/phosphatase (EEP) superfamily protein YafD
MSARPMMAGAAATLSLMAAGGGLAAWALPTASVAGPLARVLDGYTPWLLVLGLCLGALTLALGARRIGAVCVLCAVAASVAPFAAYRDVTRGADAALTADLSVVFFNAFAQNDENAARIVDAAIGTGADILVFAEAEALIDQLDTLRATYAFVSPCSAAACELLIATDLPVLRSWQLQLNPAWPDRYAVAELDLPGQGPLFLAVGHLAKPWMSGIAGPELARVTAQMNWLNGPSVVVGDFNMPPWSHPMRTLLRDTGFRAPRGGPGTWPAGAAAMMRLPIDHVLVREDVALVAVETFGEGLGSNHLGIVAQIALR